MKCYFAVLIFCVANYCQGEIVGNPANVQPKTEPCLTLFGGGNVEEGFKWMIEKAGGGDFVVLGSHSFNERIFKLGKVDSVESLIIDSPEDANSKKNIQTVLNAEAIFIPGGSQWDYIHHWEGSGVLKAINEKVNNIPIGGLSAGMAILGEYYYGATQDDHHLSSADALSDPYNDDMDNLGDNFIHCELLKNTITDTHYSERGRWGRHVAFMSRLIENNKIHGIGIDECTALCITIDGMATVVGQGRAFFLEAEKKPERCEKGKPLTWDHDGKAIMACVVEPKTKFSLAHWRGGKREYWCVVNGELKRH